MLRRRASDTQPEPPARPLSRASFCQSPSGSLRGPAGPSHGDGTAGPGEGAGPGVLRPCRPELTGDDAGRVPAAVKAIEADRITDTSKLTLRSNVRALSGPGKAEENASGVSLQGGIPRRNAAGVSSHTSNVRVEAVLRFTVLRFPIFRVLSSHGAMIGGASGHNSVGDNFAVTVLAPRS